MHDRVLRWESSRGPDARRLVVVSSGDQDETGAEGFASTVVLDPEFIVGPAFGAGGTPMAVLLDADTRVASNLAAGADAVMRLVKAAATGRELAVLEAAR